MELGNPDVPRNSSLKRRPCRPRLPIRYSKMGFDWRSDRCSFIGVGYFLFWQRLKNICAHISGPAEKSIAVLPFENLSEDKANAYFADGVQDEILTHLAKIADLKVISRTSVMQYKSGRPVTSARSARN